jgi:hypothetical protein
MKIKFKIKIKQMSFKYIWNEQNFTYIFQILEKEFPEWPKQDITNYINSSIDTTVHIPTVSIEDNNKIYKEFVKKSYVDFAFIFSQIKKDHPELSYEEAREMTQVLSERKKIDEKRKNPDTTFAEWEPFKKYIIGDTVTHYNKKYTCINEHESVYDSSAITGKEGLLYNSIQVGHCSSRPGSSPYALLFWRPTIRKEWKLIYKKDNL